MTEVMFANVENDKKAMAEVERLVNKYGEGQREYIEQKIAHKRNRYQELEEINELYNTNRDEWKEKYWNWLCKKNECNWIIEI